MGIFALGVYPIALELIVECTYPVDQAIGTAFIFLSSALQGVFLMEVENFLGKPLSEEAMLIQSCVAPDDPGHQQPKDYSTYLYVINAYMIFFIIVFIIFFKTEMKRTKADVANRQVGSCDGGSSGQSLRREPSGFGFLSRPLFTKITQMKRTVLSL